MTLTERIDQLYNEMQSKPLSAIVPQTMLIALECRDYQAFLILNFWMNPLNPNQKAGNFRAQEYTKALQGAGLEDETITKLGQLALGKYIAMRTVEKEQVATWPVREMEDLINMLRDTISALEPPEGLAPIDLYYRSESASNQKIDLLMQIQRIEKQQAVLSAYIANLLAKYRMQASSEEQQRELQKSIKNSNKVFIIYGHNKEKLAELESIIKDDFGLEPVVLWNLPKQGMTIIEMFERYASECSYAFALFTPDDIVQKGQGEFYFQARPNVIFELGWFFAHLGRNRVCILNQSSEKSEIFSDLQGIARIDFTEAIREKLQEIRRELQSVGMV